MASISLSFSDARIAFSRPDGPADGCVYFSLASFCDAEQQVPHYRDTVMFHGTQVELEGFVRQLTRAVSGAGQPDANDARPDNVLTDTEVVG